MEITFYNWWFSVYIEEAIELHIQVGWLVAAISGLFAARYLLRFLKA